MVKENTNDTRESPSIGICKNLLNEGAYLSIHDFKVSKESIDKNLQNIELGFEDNVKVNKANWEFQSNLYDAVDDYNRNYSDYKFIADHGKTKTYIQGIQTSNGKYNLVLCQPRKELTEARKKLSKTDYYKYWDKSYLKEVLEEDYSTVNINLKQNLDK